MQKIFQDQIGRNVQITYPIKRIVSLVPSITELLFHLGLEEKIAGITSFCIHPANQTVKISKIGGTKTISLNKIDDIQPDLIIASKEENKKEQIEALYKKYPTWISDVNEVENVTTLIRSLGSILNCEQKSSRLIESLEKTFRSTKDIFQNRSVAYLIWENPMMVASGETFINSILHHLGLINVFGDMARYPEIKAADILKREPDFVFLSSEPYPFKETQLKKYTSLFRFSKVTLVDGDIFSWYGNRLLKLQNYSMELYKGLVG